MNEVIENLLYTRSHEWVQKLDDSTVRIGITDHAQHEMGDVVYVELGELGASLSKGDEAGALESVKTVEPFYSPLGGKIVKINEELEGQPELVNRSPYESGWLLELELEAPEELEELLDSEAYQELMDKV